MFWTQAPRSSTTLVSANLCASSRKGDTPRKMASGASPDALLRNRREQHELLRKRKDAVCRAVFPDKYRASSSSEYRFLPERCTSSSSSGARAPPVLKLKRDELVREQARIRSLAREFPAEKHRVYAPNAVVSAKSPEQYTAMLRTDAAYKFILFALTRMVDPAEIRAQREPALRLDALLGAWQGGLLKRRGWTREADDVRRRVYGILAAQYEALLTS